MLQTDETMRTDEAESCSYIIYILQDVLHNASTGVSQWYNSFVSICIKISDKKRLILPSNVPDNCKSSLEK